MSYCAGNLCVHKKGASMHLQCGILLRRVAHRSFKSQMQITPLHNPSRAVALSTFSALTHHHEYWVTLPSWNSGIAHASTSSSFLHTFHVEKNSIKSGVIAHGAAWRKNKIHKGGAMPSSSVKQRNGHSFLMRRALSSVSECHSDTLTQAEDSCQSSSQAVRMLDDSGALPNGRMDAKKFVVVVESPTKAKTIQKYLGPEYIVLPSYGHVRDLAARAGSVRPNDDYTMVWEVPETAQTHVAKIKKALARAQCLILASDPDREGEAIAWHIYELLKAEDLVKSRKLKVTRVTFNEITKASVLRAMQKPRDICSTLVTAYLARRALDHLIGFALSPILWRKLPGSRSAGRVQSVALKLVCEREKEIEESVQREYWTVEAFASVKQPSLFPIRPTHFDGKKIEKFSLSSDDAKLLSERLRNLPIKASAVRKHSKRRTPLQPYITSTLQMDAQAKLGYGAVRTMTLAQKLYEGVKLENEESTGLITYMRTDGFQLSNDAVQDIRALAAQRYGDEYVPKNLRTFNSKVKNAQEAHEAIRPTDVYRLPSQLRHVLEKDALLLYTLIWRRTMACQMEHAVYEEVSVDFVTQDGDICLQASGSFISFPGFLAAMEDKQAPLSIESEIVADDAESEEIAPAKHTEIFGLKQGDVVVIKKAEPEQHFTRPPARYSEGLLVKAMEELGIGRPSTYATMLKTLESRKYVKIDHHRIIPEVRGQMVAAFLSQYFPKYVDYNFTARLEEQLDEVSGGKAEWKEVLRGFWPEFESVVVSSMKVPIEKVIEMLQETLSPYCFKGLGINVPSCPSCGAGKLTLKLSRYGSGYFFGCDKFPDCSFKAQVLSSPDASSSIEENKDDTVLRMVEKFDVLLGLDPATNMEVRAKRGPFGYYIQLGSDNKHRKFFKIPDGVDPTSITFEKAKELMKYPRTLGEHPEDGKVVSLGIGMKCFFIKHGNYLAYAPKGEVGDDITLERAVQLLKGKTVIHRGRKTRAMVEAEEKERRLKKAKARKLAAKTAVKPVAAKATESSMEGGEMGELKPKKLPRRKKIDLVARSENAETASVCQGNVMLPTTQNEGMDAIENDDLVAPKARGRKKASIAMSERVSSEENEASSTMQKEVLASTKSRRTRAMKALDGKVKSEKITHADDDESEVKLSMAEGTTKVNEESKVKAKRSSSRSKIEVVAGEEESKKVKAKRSYNRSKIGVVAGEEESKKVEAKRSLTTKRSSSQSKIEVVAGEEESEKLKAKRSSSRSKIEVVAGEEKSENVEEKRSPKQVKIEVVPIVSNSATTTSARRANKKLSADDGGQGSKSTTRQKKERAVETSKL